MLKSKAEWVFEGFQELHDHKGKMISYREYDEAGRTTKVVPGPLPSSSVRRASSNHGDILIEEQSFGAKYEMTRTDEKGTPIAKYTKGGETDYAEYRYSTEGDLIEMIQSSASGEHWTELTRKLFEYSDPYLARPGAFALIKETLFNITIDEREKRGRGIKELFASDPKKVLFSHYDVEGRLVAQEELVEGSRKVVYSCEFDTKGRKTRELSEGTTKRWEIVDREDGWEQELYLNDKLVGFEKYRGDSKLLESDSFFDDGSLGSRSLNNYDDRGNLIEQVVDLSHLEIGDKRRSGAGGKYIERWKYNDAGKVVDHTYVLKFEKDPFPGLTIFGQRESTVYNDKGDPVEEVRISKEHNVAIHRWEYEYYEGSIAH